VDIDATTNTDELDARRLERDLRVRAKGLDPQGLAPTGSKAGVLPIPHARVRSVR